MSEKHTDRSFMTEKLAKTLVEAKKAEKPGGFSSRKL